MELQKVLILLLLLGCTPSDRPTRELKQLTYSYHTEMKKKYGLDFLAQSDIRAPSLSKISFDYAYEGSVSIGEARLMIHQLVNEFVARINEDREMAHKFAHFPITVSDLEVSISFIQPTTDHLERNPSHVTLLKGEVYYSAYDPSQKVLKNIKHERFVVP